MSQIRRSVSIGSSRHFDCNKRYHVQFQGSLECDSETVFELAAHVLQSAVGDYTDEHTARKQLKKLPVLPTSALKEHPSLTFCEDKVLEYYKKLAGTARGSGVVNYMTIVESLPTYGIHYYEVKDKSQIPWWLGLSYKGISLYDYSDKRVPRKTFAWKQLENLYFRDKKFSIEVHDPKRVVHTLSSFNLYEDAIQESVHEFDELNDAISDPTTQVSVSRRTFGPGNVNVHAWFAATPQLTKCIWSMAVSQHQFYLDRKQSKSQLPSVRSMSEIAADLCTSTTSLPSSGYSGGNSNISRSNSAASLGQLSSHNSKTELTQDDIDNARAAQREMYLALKSKKEALEELMRRKNEKLKELCLKEAELTGELPFETPLTPGEPLPQIRKRVGTAFSLSPNIIWLKEENTEEEEILAKLELEYELQKKISEAALRLAKDKTVAKNVRKKRKQSYHKIHQQFKDIEKKLNECRLNGGRTPLHKNYNSADELSEDSREFLDSDNEVLSPVNSPHIGRHDTSQQTRQTGRYVRHNNNQVRAASTSKINSSVDLDSMRPSTPSSQGSGQRSSPASQPRHPHPHGLSRGNTPSPGPPRAPGDRFTPNSVYTTRTVYRNQSYPSFNTHGAYPSQPPHNTPYNNHHHHVGANNNNHGNSSDYDNTAGDERGRGGVDYTAMSATTPSPHHSSSSSVNTTTQQQPDYVANMYNLNMNKMSHYESSSGDELRSPHSQSSAVYGQQSEYYDSFPTDHPAPAGPHGYQYTPHGHRAPGIPRTNSFESTSSSRGGGGEPFSRGFNNSHYPGGGGYQYGSLDRNTGLPYRQDDELSEMSIPELLPTKFGSKRESHSDKRDSPYYTGGDHYRGQGYDVPHQHRHAQDNAYNTQPVHQEYGIPSQGYNNERTMPPNSSSHSSITSSASGNAYYEHAHHNRDGNLRQQAPPSTPQFESPPPAFIRQDVPPLYHHTAHNSHSSGHMHQSSHHHHQKQSSLITDTSQTPQQRPMTVTKYSNYVEVSKPFEMSDVYIYSEKMRKGSAKGEQDGSSGPASPAHSAGHGSHAGPGGSGGQRLHSPYMTRAAALAAASNHSASRSRSNSPNSVLSQEAGISSSSGFVADGGSGYVQTPASSRVHNKYQQQSGYTHNYSGYNAATGNHSGRTSGPYQPSPQYTPTATPHSAHTSNHNTPHRT